MNKTVTTQSISTHLSAVEKPPIILKPEQEKIAKVKPIVLPTKVEPSAKAEFTVDTHASRYPQNYSDELRRQDDQSSLLWERFSPSYMRVNERIKFKISYLGGIHVGSIIMKIHPPTEIKPQGHEPADCFHFSAFLQSAKYYSFIYELNDSLHSYLHRKTYTPRLYDLKQNETGKSVSDVQKFNAESLKTYFDFKQIKKGKESSKNLSADIPYYFQDVFSSLYFIRGLQLQVGQKFEFPVISKAKVLILAGVVEGIEKKMIHVQTLPREVSTYRLKVESELPGDLKKNGSIYVWLTDDSARIPVLFSAKIKLGSIEGELTEYDHGTARIE